jgi:hypothetical protein
VADAAGRLTRRALLGGLGTAALAALGGPRPGAAQEWAPHAAAGYGADTVVAWVGHALDLARTTRGVSPPVAARAFGYAGVALYEAVVPGMPEHRCAAGLLTGLAPAPPAGEPPYHWPTVAATALAGVLRALFPAAPAATRVAGTVLEATQLGRFQLAVPSEVFVRSVERGAGVAEHVLAWSATDGSQEAATRPTPFRPPVGPGLWVPTPPGFLPALLPYWGETRRFLSGLPGGCAGAPPVPFSVSARSDFRGEALRVYEATRRLTDEQRAVALFWSDDPGVTVTPPGHSLSILGQVLAQRGATLDVAAEAFLKVGVAVADAFTACWQTKYRLNLLRPVTYIQREVDPDWMPVLVTPPFPEHTSGHSVQSGAAAEVLTALFGKVAFTDRTHERRGLPPRHFSSFWQAAREAAISRLYGGIHFVGAIVAGLDQGRCIGQAVNALRLRR